MKAMPAKAINRRTLPRGHPFRHDVELGDTVVVPVEEGQEVLRQVVLIGGLKLPMMPKSTAR